MQGTKLSPSGTKMSFCMMMDTFLLPKTSTLYLNLYLCGLVAESVQATRDAKRSSADMPEKAC